MTYRTKRKTMPALCLFSLIAKLFCCRYMGFFFVLLVVNNILQI